MPSIRQPPAPKQSGNSPLALSPSRYPTATCAASHQASPTGSPYRLSASGTAGTWRASARCQRAATAAMARKSPRGPTDKRAHTAPGASPTGWAPVRSAWAPTTGPRTMSAPTGESGRIQPTSSRCESTTRSSLSSGTRPVSTMRMLRGCWIRRERRTTTIFWGLSPAPSGKTLSATRGTRCL